MSHDREQHVPEILLSRYQILEKLGSGGMAVVYKARDKKLGRLVALKFISPDRLQDASSISRFVQEAQTISQLNHPNICIVHDILEYQEMHFMVMELIEGQTLRKIMDQRGALPLDQVLEIGTKVADALQAAHQAGIIHRDVKPENIMICTNGAVKVMDFGLAKLRTELGARAETGQPSQQTFLKSVSGLYGTDAYMSPEQIDGLPLDERTDIFSLGIVLYEMLAGRLPFTGHDPIAVMKAILHHTPEPINGKAHGAVAELDRIMQKALGKKPEERQQSMSELYRALRTIQSLFKRPEPFRKIKWYAAAGTLLIFLMMIFAILLRFNGSGQSEQGTSLSLRLHSVGVTSETEDFPSFFPDGNEIVYASKNSGFEDLFHSVWRKALTSDAAQKLMEGAIMPDVSPDGSRLVFSRGKRLYIYTLADQDSIQISRFGSFPKWSTDGRQIAFSTTGHHRPMENNAIFVYDLASDTVEQVSPQNGLQYCSPSWSSDSRLILCVGGEGSRGELWLIDPLKKNGRPISSMDTWIKHPVFSPSNKYIYFLSNKNGSFDLWRTVVDVAHSRLVGVAQQITVGLEIMSFDISPKGDKLIFSRNESRETIWRIPLYTGSGGLAAATSIVSNTQATENMEISPDRNWMVLETSFAGSKTLFLKSMLNDRERTLYHEQFAFAPAWSADGQWILFDAGGGNLADIWRISPDGQVSEKRIASDVADWSPTCSPDGAYVCFISNRDGHYNLWLHHLLSGTETQITHHNSTKTRGFWSHDSKRLAFMENCPDRNGCRIVLYTLENQHLQEVLHLPRNTITLSHKLAWKYNDTALYYLISAREPFYVLDLKNRVKKIALNFTHPNHKPGSNCVFAVQDEILYLVSSNYMSDIWIAEGSL